MNALDKFIGWFSPKAALEREYARYRLNVVQASGYGNHGATPTLRGEGKEDEKCLISLA